MFCYQDKIVKHYVHELLLNLSQNMLMFKREGSIARITLLLNVSRIALFQEVIFKPVALNKSFFKNISSPTFLRNVCQNNILKSYFLKKSNSKGRQIFNIIRTIDPSQIAPSCLNCLLTNDL